MSDRIDLNTANDKILTQLPGVNITIARAIVNHRRRHGWFTAWKELETVKGFPVDRLADIKQQARLSCPEDRPGQTQTECVPPHHLDDHRLSRVKTGGYTRKLRTSRRTAKHQEHPRAA